MTRATVYRAALIPPTARGARGAAAHPARYGVAVLIETTNLDTLSEVQDSDSYKQLHDILSEASPDVLAMPARCTRLIAGRPPRLLAHQTRMARSLPQRGAANREP